MKGWTLPMLGVVTLVAMTLTAAAAMADEKRQSVTVAFGRGLNTAGLPNHAILPDTIKVKAGGVVHFLVAGFHQITIYNPGKELDDLVVPATGRFIDDTLDRFYQGIVPATINPPVLPVTDDPSNARNRVESVSFAAPGTYLVICNVRTHFNDGMFAIVKVVDND